MVTMSKEYMQEYMKNYMKKNAESIVCELCDGKYKIFNKHKHVKTQKHQGAVRMALKQSVEKYSK